MSVVVRPLRADDAARFLELIDGLADYERLPRPDAAARQRLIADALSDPPRFRTLLAEIDGEVLGYAIYFFTYSSFRARPTLYLEDVFVVPERRGEGAGVALFRACAREAVANACARMEWQVLSWNTPSIEFYKRLGARQLEDWLPFRLDDEALRAAAEPSAVSYQPSAGSGRSAVHDPWRPNVDFGNTVRTEGREPGGSRPETADELTADS